MKYKFSIVCAIIIGFAFSTFGQTDDNSVTRGQAIQSLKQDTATNLNEVVIQALSGVSTASGEIYQASKEAIHKSVDFVTEQAPDVMKQFLMWKFVASVIYASFTLLAIVTYGFIVFRVYKWEASESCRGDFFATPMMGIIGGMVCLFLIGVVVIPNTMTAVEIKVAPKIYVIEYVAQALHPQRGQHQ